MKKAIEKKSLLPIDGFDDGMTDKILEQFQAEIDDLADEIDPDGEHDWYSMTVGWAIGKGWNPETAHAIARYVRYDTNLG
jgi:hypothetical protein